MDSWFPIGARLAELINHSIGDGPTVARKALEAGRRHGHGRQSLRNHTCLAGALGQDSRERRRRSSAPHSARQVCAWDSSIIPTLPTGPAYEATPERRAVARKVADETMVLLKNDPVEGVGALLPLTSKAKKDCIDWAVG